ncbi:hypothetical protein [Allorhizocola rhizosphaerae]|uniref:hypothetical protein n=1 Tax=Allorhizocola rhizosphaerae TaxID=1872709 RepID=UPI000E3CF0E3|nr:hypothetical protein [Allorhizocola rhizosphaerae]
MMARSLAALLISVTGMVALADAAHADAVPGGKLFAGGTFTQAGGSTATNIAAWNGVDWSALVGPNGEGADSQVTAMTMFQGELIVGGSFLEAGGEIVSGVASWDGTDWEPLVSSNGAIGLAILPLGFVSDLEVFNGELYAGGAFPRGGGQDVNNIAKWNGTDWLPVTGPSGTGVLQGGSDVGAVVWDMTLVDGQLIVAGRFDTAGGVPANSIAAWNGTTWSSLDQPALQDLTILSVENYNGRVVAGRSYVVDNFNVNDVAWRDSGVWSALGDTFNGNVRDMTIHNGLLVAGGQYQTIGTTTVNRIATWNGSTWSALSGPSGVGTNGDVFAVASHWGFLFAGGFFSNAGGQTVANIARWNGSAWSAVPGGGFADTVPTVFELLST